MSQRSLLILVAMLPIVANAQKLVNATEQCWSGGIAGHRGCNYTFVIAFSSQLQAAVPQSLWIGTKAFSLQLKDSIGGDAGNMVRTAGRHQVKYTIRVATRFDDYENRFPYPPGDKTPDKLPAPPVNYNGVALLAYSINGQQKFFVINKIIEHFPNISYP